MINKCELSIASRLLFVSILILAVCACKKLPETSECSATGTIGVSVAEFGGTKPVSIGKTLSAKIAMDALFEAVDDGQMSRYIWKNIDSPPASTMNRSVPITKGNNGEVWALGFKELASDCAILVTGLTQLDERGEPERCHACSGRASTFFFSRNENKDWILTNVELDVNQFGSHGGSGTFSFVELGTNRFGFLFDSGGTWQGYTVSSIEIFEISKVSKTIPRTKKPIRIFADHGCDESDLNENCFSVRGEWKFVPGPVADVFDLVIDFNGFKTEEKKGHRDVRERARYRLNGNFYELVEGSNAVPEV